MLVNKKDEIVMKLVHYLITEYDYTPIVVNGVKDEIWLESSDGPYRIVRINSNYIHNAEQYDFDIFKTKSIMKQIKKKTMSFKVTALNIFLDLNSSVKLTEDNRVTSLKVKSIKDLKGKSFVEIFPDIKEKLIESSEGLDLIVNVTKDINTKTEAENKVYEKTFAPKKLLITPILIAISVVVYLVGMLGFADKIVFYGAVSAPFVKAGEIYRLLTGTFIHADIFHIGLNMYALYAIGSQLETYLGRSKFLAIYLLSAITGSLMSCIIGGALFSVGASGAIFGLMGALVYFGYHYRLYLGKALKNQIIPLILLNLLMGFMLTGIDNAAHIGGLVGGFLITIGLGINGKSKKEEQINGWIVFAIYFGFLTFMALFFK